MSDPDPLTILLEAFNWGSVVSSLIFGYFTGRFYGQYRYTRQILAAVLFVCFKQHKRGTYFAPYDLAVIKVAADHIKETK
jgi:hypothetical protein